MIAGAPGDLSFLDLPPGGRVLASGIGFTEGPAVVDDGTVWVTSINRGRLYAVALDGSGAEVAVETGGGPNCVAVGSDGSLYCTQNAATVMPTKSDLPTVPSIQRVVGDRAEIVVEGIDRPSDAVTGPDKRLWFTDPPDHSMDTTPSPGVVRAWDPVTGVLTTEIDGLFFPNGLAFGADPDELYVAETAAGVIRRHRRGADGFSPDGWVATMPHGNPDGIAFDVEGWLWVAGARGHNLVAFGPDGDVRAELGLGDGTFITSVCFAGPDRDVMVVTAAKGGLVLALEPSHPGLPLPVHRAEK